MTEKVFKTREVIEKEFAELPDIDPTKVIAISDFNHNENWHVEKRYFADNWKLKRETVFHTPDKEEAIRTAKRYNKGKEHIIGVSNYDQGEVWYEVTFGYPFFDRILRTWSKHVITKNIPFDAKIRIIVHEGIIPPISIMNQDAEHEQIKMKKAFEDTLMYLNTVDFNDLPDKLQSEIDRLITRIHEDSGL